MDSVEVHWYVKGISERMVILFLGDIFGKPGRRAVAGALQTLKERYQPDFVLANIENLAGGRGVTEKSLREIKELGMHGFTSGNHIWGNRKHKHQPIPRRKPYQPINLLHNLKMSNQ